MVRKNRAFLKTALRSLALWGTAGLHANTVYLGSSGDINDPGNWSAGVPTSSNIAEFNNLGSGNTSARNSAEFSALGLVFDANAPAYYLYNNVNATQNFAIGSSGIVNNSSNTQIVANDSSGIGLITVAGGSTGTNTSFQSYNGVPGNGGVTLLSATDASGSSFELFSYSTLTTNGECSLGPVYLGDVTFPLTDNIFINNGPCSVESLTLIYGSNFTMNADCSIGSLIEVDSTSTVTLASGTLTVGDGANPIDDYVYGPISGPGAFVFNPTTDNAYFGFSTSANTYTGGTVVNGGNLYTFSGATLAPTGTITVNGGTLEFGNNQTTGNLSGLGGSVIIDTPHTLTVNQTSNETYAGQFVGANGTTFAFGTIGSLTAIGTLQLTGDSSGFSGDVFVNSGNLQVNNNLGGNSFTVNSGATLSGTGTFGTSGKLATIASGGTLSPGNSVGVITNLGSQSFLSGSFFRLEENGYTTGPVTPSNSLLIVDQSATVNGGSTVNLVTTNGYINLNTKQAFLTTGTGLTVNSGGFTLDTSGLSSLFNPEAYSASLSYDSFNYYILTQTEFANEVRENGGGGVAAIIAAKLDKIVDPNTPVNFFLNDLARLSGPELIVVLDTMSGAQYATEVFFAETANRQFIRRLYDPLRELVTTLPCCNVYCCTSGLDVWGEVGGGQRRVNGFLGAQLSEWDVTLGVQKTFNQVFTVGVAGSYEHNNLHYNHSNGSGNGFSWFGGAYGLYRPASFYVLADIAYGFSQHNVERHLLIFDTTNRFTGKPEASQVTFYAEGGIDVNLCPVLIQPFLGIEVGGVFRNGFSEREIAVSDLGLNIHKRNNTTATSSLGVHLTDQFFNTFNVSIDLAWLYRLTENVYFDSNFLSIPGPFPVLARNVGRSSGQGAITFAKDWDNVRVYVEGSGEIWSRASIYNVLAGLQLTW